MYYCIRKKITRKIELLFWITCFIIVAQFFLPTSRKMRDIRSYLPTERFRNPEFNGIPYESVEDYTTYYTARSNLKPLRDAVLLLPYVIKDRVINDVTSFKYPINDPAVCSSSNSLQLFIAVISAPGYFEKRQTIRQTWMRHLTFPVSVAFFVGLTRDVAVQRKIQEENASYGDIIQIGMLDSYSNLTQKSVAVLNWIYNYCPEVAYVLKCDDDLYINAHNLYNVLLTLPSEENFIFGSRNPAVVQRSSDAAGKWRVSFDVWPWNRYPPYHHGPSYLMSRKTVDHLLAAAQVTPYFTFEDVYISGLCVQKSSLMVHRWSDRMNIFKQLSADRCLAGKSITWMTTSTTEMNASHRAVEDFYRNMTQCRTTG